MNAKINKTLIIPKDIIKCKLIIKYSTEKKKEEFTKTEIIIVGYY